MLSNLTGMPCYQIPLYWFRSMSYYQIFLGLQVCHVIKSLDLQECHVIKFPWFSCILLCYQIPVVYMCAMLSNSFGLQVCGVIKFSLVCRYAMLSDSLG